MCEPITDHNQRTTCHELVLSFYHGILGMELRPSGMVVCLPDEPSGQFSLFIMTVCVCHVWVTCMCGGQRTFRNQFSPSTWTLGIELKLSGLYGKCFYLLFPPCLNQPFYSTTLPQIIALQASLTYKWQMSHRSGQAAISGSLSLPFLFLPELNSMWWPEAQHLSRERDWGKHFAPVTWESLTAIATIWQNKTPLCNQGFFLGGGRRGEAGFSVTWDQKHVNWHTTTELTPAEHMPTLRTCKA